MSKQTVTLHIYARIGEYDKPGTITVFDCDMRKSPTCMRDMVWLGTQDVEIDIPEIDTTAAQIDALQDQIKQARTQFEQTQNLLLERISKLRAIGHEVAQ